MDLTISLLWVLVAALLLLMLVQGLTRKVDFFSIRNCYLGGFIVYQLVSPAATLSSSNWHNFRINDPERAGTWVLLFAFSFLVVFLLSYHKLPFTPWLARKLTGRAQPVEANDALLTGLAIAVVTIAIPMWLVGTKIPVMRALAGYVPVALSALACAIAGWVWGKRRLNPAVLAMVAFVLVTGMGLAMTNAVSRRPLISILGGFTWGAYYRWARHVSPARLVAYTVPLVLLGGAFVSAFTAIRSHKTPEMEVQATVQQMRGGDVKAGAMELLSGQASGAATLWILEHYPDQVEYKHLFSFRYMLYWYIPRLLWEDKPETLANDIAGIASVKGVNPDAITMPPGVIGYAGAEGGFYALVLYALFFGQFTRFFDELIRLNPDNPYVILPVGCAIGQFLGLARGEIAVFTNLALIGFLSSFLIMYLTRFAFGRSAPMPYGLPQPRTS
jgi:hypothetical protein